MKRLMWIFAIIPVVVTSIVLQFMPSGMPMHNDLAGNTDRWGSKMESLILPICILYITLFWNILVNKLEKKAVNANGEKEQIEAKASAKVLCIIGFAQAVMFGIMQYYILYNSYVQASTGGSKTSIDIAKVSCILCGIMFVITGSFIDKTKKNAVVGVRTTWSLYNDNTWRKSNHFGAIALIIAGLLTIITTVFAKGISSTIIMLVYILLTTVIVVLYSKRVYNYEKDKEIS